LAALILTYQYFGTWDFPQLFSLAGELKNNGSSAAPSGLFWIPLLLVAGALIKSAQFPFHSWLPDTMETPTPVSALMHAGIINAGGFLIIRLSPIVSLSPASLNGLAIIGAITALYASVVMLTQTSIKRSLAYSTIAQMGFMMLQCGLGAFSLAMLHIVAHSLYKAHAFLSSGSIVQMARHAWVPKGNPSAHPLILISSMLLAILITLGMGTLFNLSWQADVGVQVLGCVMMMALAHFLWSLWGSGFLPKLLFWGFGITTLSAFLYYSLHTLSYALFANSLPNYAPARSALEYVVMALIVALFFTVLLFQSQVATWSRHSFWQTLYVHAYNGFYLGTLTSRLMGRKDTRARL
jgi:NAD(P)H-quinone oxidoreductase subunit 5